MANRTFLLAHASPDVIPAHQNNPTILRAANYSVPVFWFALFSPEHKRRFLVDALDASGNTAVLEVPSLHTALADAKARFGAAACLLTSLLPLELHHHLDAWSSLLAELREPYIQVDLSELGMMMSDQEFESSLSMCLRALNSQSDQDLDELFAQASLTFNGLNQPIGFDPEVVEYNLIGYNW